MSHAPQDVPRRQLLLLRHAQATQSTAGVTDFHRTLTERGELEAELIAERLRNHRLGPARIVASPALRARRSAEIIARALGLAHASIQLEPRLYLADSETIVSTVANSDDACNPLVVVGHNPGLSAAAHRLCPGIPVGSLPTAAVIAIDVCGSWAELLSATRTLRYYAAP